jgi:L-lactate dehydrogenase complex protein LldG
MAELHKIVATLKDALESSSARDKHEGTAATIPVAPGTHRAELATRFARELEAVGGRFLGIVTPAEMIDRIVAAARERGIKLAAIGEGVVNDSGPIVTALSGAGITMMRPVGAADPETRHAMRERLARADLGIAEAHFAIASTGTLAVLSTAARPSALTLLPPASLVIVQIDRMVSDLAAAIEALGPEVFATHRITMITGPSRTADIEKRIVMGVHGPKSLDVVVVWPQES